MVPYTPPESIDTGTVCTGALPILTCRLAVGEPATATFVVNGLGPNSSTPWDSSMSTPLLRVPGNAGITLLVPGNKLLGPMPNTPTTPEAAK